MPKKSKLSEQTELTPIQQRFALQVAVLNNTSHASRMVGISDRTGRRWMDIPLIQEYIHELQNQAFSSAMHLLEISTLSAVTMLNEAMNSEKTDNALKVKAAQILLDRGIKAHKVKLLDERMASLEQRLAMYTIVKEGEIVE